MLALCPQEEGTEESGHKPGLSAGTDCPEPFHVAFNIVCVVFVYSQKHQSPLKVQ